jgi:hypothetical protein
MVHESGPHSARQFADGCFIGLDQLHSSLAKVEKRASQRVQQDAYISALAFACHGLYGQPVLSASICASWTRGVAADGQPADHR